MLSGTNSFNASSRPMNIKLPKRSPDQLLSIITTALVIFALVAVFKIAGYPLIIPFLFLFLGIHLRFFRKAKVRLFLDLGLLLTVMILIANAFLYYWNFPVLYIPVASLGMLTMLLFNDLQLTFLMSFAGSIAVSMIIGGDFGMMITFFLGSLTGGYFVKEARNRGQLINAGVFIGLVQLVCLFLLNPHFSLFLNRDFLNQQLYPLVSNGFISVFVTLATLKVFEYLFGVLTNFSLLELSDFNQPLLKRMILEAPGTYHHSLIVGNLSEAAADAIGANSLLARVGAYYHDIGKMEKPEYFTENQLVGGNKHDVIEPSVSRLVILNHVKEGMELAKKYKLNQLIIDFIPQHHGTSLMHYFYQRSIEEAKEGETIDESDYRYPGPKPQMRETAITMLADSVEGATRALDDPDPGRIEETVKKIINNKFIDGQLDECNLTLKEIEKISQTFIRILCAMYHTRIKYPEKKNGSSRS